MTRPGTLLRNRDFRLLVTGSTVSLLGDGIYAVAFAVTVLTVSPTASARVTAAVPNPRSTRRPGDRRSSPVHNAVAGRQRVNPGEVR